MGKTHQDSLNKIKARKFLENRDLRASTFKKGCSIYLISFTILPSIDTTLIF